MPTALFVRYAVLEARELTNTVYDECDACLSGFMRSLRTCCGSFCPLAACESKHIAGSIDLGWGE